MSTTQQAEASKLGILAREGEEIPAAPFVAWISEQIAARDIPDLPKHSQNGASQLARELGVSDRLIYRYRNSLDGDGRPTEWFRRNRVEDLLDAAGVRFAEVYVDYDEDIAIEPEAWCSPCREFVTPIDGACPWCDSKTGPRGIGQHGRLGQRITDQQLRDLHTLHMRARLPVAELGRRTYERFGYQTAGSADQAIRLGWRRLRLEPLPRAEVMRAWNEHYQASRGPMLDESAMREAIFMHAQCGMTIHATSAALVHRSRVRHSYNLARWLTEEFRARGVVNRLRPRQRELVRLASRPQGVTTAEANKIMGGGDGWGALDRLRIQAIIEQPEIRGPWFAVEMQARVDAA